MPYATGRSRVQQGFGSEGFGSGGFGSGGRGSEAVAAGPSISNLSRDAITVAQVKQLGHRGDGVGVAGYNVVVI